MNKILLSHGIVSCEVDSVEILDNVINIASSGEYLVEYIDSGNYDIVFNINGNVKIIESSFDNILNNNIKYNVLDGELTVIKFYNNFKVSELVDVDLCSLGSKFNYYFSNITRENEKYTININHKNKNTSSVISNKSIALKNSFLKFLINSNVGNDCNGSLLDQSTRIVTMGECDASISPNMFVDLDDVIAKHGSIIGSFKEEQIFYLMSKGIGYNDTLKLLIRGYLFSNLGQNNYFKDKIESIIDMYWR